MSNRIVCSAVLVTLLAVAVIAAPIPDELLGDWVSGCEPAGPGNTGMRFVTFSSGGWRLRYNFYIGDTTCTRLSWAMIITGLAQAHTSTSYAGPADATTVDLQIGTRSVRVVNQQAATFLNSVCQPTVPAQQFQSNQTFTGDFACPSLGLPTQASCPIEYEIIRLYNGALQFGMLGSSLCSASTRPTTWQTETAVRNNIPIVSPGVYRQPCQSRPDGTSVLIVMTVQSAVYPPYLYDETYYQGPNCVAANAMYTWQQLATYEILNPATQGLLSSSFNSEFVIQSASLFLHNTTAGRAYQAQLQAGCTPSTFPLETYVDLRLVSCAASLPFQPLSVCPVDYETISTGNVLGLLGRQLTFTQFSCTGTRVANAPVSLQMELVYPSLTAGLYPSQVVVGFAFLGLFVGLLLMFVICCIRNCCCGGAKSGGSDAAAYKSYDRA